MTFVGINGFGRIGKCIFLQLLREDHLHVKAINAPDFDITKLEAYLKNDSVHRYAKDFHIDIQSDSSFTINGHLIHICESLQTQFHAYFNRRRCINRIHYI
jgi:glyceraldehyde-3-phosphate dehydrogenase/erythrose-4-phosphate dehydrogenase